MSHARPCRRDLSVGIVIYIDDTAPSTVRLLTGNIPTTYNFQRLARLLHPFLLRILITISIHSIDEIYKNPFTVHILLRLIIHFR